MRLQQKAHASFSAYFLIIAFGFVLGLSPAFLNLLIDPYELVMDRDRPQRVSELAEKAHYPLWKLGNYRHGKYETIVLGDSRARALREKYWNSFEWPLTKNLGYGGGTIPEIFETFKLVRNDPALKNLVIGIQLRSFDEDHKRGMNRVPEAVSLINAPVRYVFNWSIAKTSLKIAQIEYRHIGQWINNFSFGPAQALAADENNSIVDRHLNSISANLFTTSVRNPARTLPDKFARQVSRNARSDWRGFEFSDKYWSMLEEIGEWAKANNKRLVFVIPPTIVEMQKTISDYGLAGLNQNLRARLAENGVVFDFDYPNNIVRELENFSDAYHFNANIARQIVGEVVGHLSSDSHVQQQVAKRKKVIRCAEVNPARRVTVITRPETSLAVGENCRIWSS